MSSNTNSRKNKNEKGFSLIELLISVTVFLIGISAIYGVTKLATIQKNTVNTRTDQLRSARIALEYIRRDTLNAGFGYHRTGGNIPDNTGNLMFGLKSDTDSERDFMTSVMSGNDITNNSLSFGVKTDVITVISRDALFNSADSINAGALINYTKAEASGTAINVTTPTNACTKCQLNDIYLFESASGTTQVIGMVTSRTNSSVQLSPGVNDPFKLNQSASATGNNQSLFVTTSGGGTIKRINLISYAVTPEGVLVRKKYGNRADKGASEQIETRELVYGVSDFQIKYFMEDGTTVDDPSLGNDGRSNQIKMNGVVQIQVSITLAPSANDSQPMITSPITIKEFISTKNLRYEAS